MKFVSDMIGEITESGYSINNGKITLKIRYKSKSRGFLICVSKIFSDPVPVENQQILERLDGCIERSGNSILFSYNEREYQFFYVTEDKIRTRGSELTLPGTVRSPAKIDIFWVDEQRNAHSEQGKVSSLIIPISIVVKLEQVKELFRKRYLNNIQLKCLEGSELGDDILYYRVNRKDVYYPIPKQLIKNGIITLRTEEELTISVEVFEKYRKFYKVQVSR